MTLTQRGTVIRDDAGSAQGYNYNNITSETTTYVSVKPGFLHSITINTPVASGVIVIYDNTAASGTTIGTITLPATLLNQGPMTAVYDVVFNTALTIATSGAECDITVAYVNAD